MSHYVKSCSAALSVLARHGHIKERLTRAYEENLTSIDGDELPVPMRQPFADLKHLMHRVAPLNGEGAICASVRKMSVEDADRCAQLIVDLYGAAIRYAKDTKGQARLPLAEVDQPQVPPFLVKSG